MIKKGGNAVKGSVEVEFKERHAVGDTTYEPGDKDSFTLVLADRLEQKGVATQTKKVRNRPEPTEEAAVDEGVMPADGPTE